MAYLPWLSESTLTVILVLRLRACTKAPRNPLPSGPVTVPAMVAASAADTAAQPAIAKTKPSVERVTAAMASSSHELFCWRLANRETRRHRDSHCRDAFAAGAGPDGHIDTPRHRPRLAAVPRGAPARS